MEIYLIRHAQSENNATQLQDFKNRVSDPALTELGHVQAEALARHMTESYSPEDIWDGLRKHEPNARQQRGYNLQKLYCSPMYRTLQTAAPLAKATGLTPHVWVDIHEHGGIFLEDENEGIVSYPGKTNAEIEAEFPGYVIPENVTDKGWWSGGMEDIVYVYGRASRVALKLREDASNNPDLRIGIVSHGTFISALIKAIFNQLPGTDTWYYHFNTAITRIDIQPDGSTQLLFMNRVDHLNAETLT